MGGPLVPWAPTVELHNIYSVADGFECEQEYSRMHIPPVESQGRLSKLNNRLFSPAMHRELAVFLVECEGTEAGR